MATILPARHDKRSRPSQIALRNSPEFSFLVRESLHSSADVPSQLNASEALAESTFTTTVFHTLDLIGCRRPRPRKWTGKGIATLAKYSINPNFSLKNAQKARDFKAPLSPPPSYTQKQIILD